MGKRSKKRRPIKKKRKRKEERSFHPFWGWAQMGKRRETGEGGKKKLSFYIFLWAQMGKRREAGEGG